VKAWVISSGHIREMDALVHVVRLFEDGDVINPLGSIDPLRDIDIIDTEADARGSAGKLKRDGSAQPEC